MRPASNAASARVTPQRPYQSKTVRPHQCHNDHAPSKFDSDTDTEVHLSITRVPAAGGTTSFSFRSIVFSMPRKNVFAICCVIVEAPEKIVDHGGSCTSHGPYPDNQPIVSIKSASSAASTAFLITPGILSSGTTLRRWSPYS